MALERALYEFWDDARETPAGRRGWFDPAAVRTLQDTSAGARILSEIGEKLPGANPVDTALLLFRSLDIVAAEEAGEVESSELVATVPAGFAVEARSTGTVVQEMLEDARREVVGLGYQISDTGVIRQLQAVSARAVDVILVCDRQQGSAVGLRAGWSASAPPPVLYEDRERPGAGPYASMHSKSLLVDGNDLLLTSANFTHHGFQENIEFGIRLRGRVARNARRLYGELFSSGALREVPWDQATASP